MNAPEQAPNPLHELIRARIREFLREPGYVFWVFGFPLLMALGLGLAFRSKAPEPPHIAVTEQVTQSTQAALQKTSRLRVQRLPRAAAERALARTKVDLVVDQPDPAHALVFKFDPAQERGQLARAVTEDVLERAAGRRAGSGIQDQPVSEKGSRYVDFLVPGLIGLNLMGSSMWGIGFNLVLARKRKLLRRYAVTPMRRSHFLLSYFFSRSLFLVMELAVLIGFGRLVFGTEIQGSIAALLVASVLGASAFAAIGFLIGARLTSTEVAGGWMNFVQLPMWLLSGSFFSYERFPEWLQLPIRFLPLTAANDSLRRIYNEGAGLSSVGFELVVLLLWSLLGFVIALRIFKWQ
ncbi:MAG: multidrug efflux pump, inner rane subunit [Polyangiaceae bacterium]|jgi:ABC-type multidrug transport system permease subunit|nr:multidrug efflux pump, inner rane subunit [Polyangiaceae bacterium]